MRFFGINHEKYWKERKIDWDAHYLSTWNHPHRHLISEVLGTFYWVSLIELGVGGGANLKNILTYFKGKKYSQVGGTDINPDAIAFCQKTFNHGVFQVCSLDDLHLSDKASDVSLTDMSLIYIGPTKINKVLNEMKRITRNSILLCEFHSTKWWERLYVKLKTGYNTYNYKQLLEAQGFYDIITYKLPAKVWPGGLQEKYGYLIKASVPRR